MKVTQEKLPASQIGLTIEVPAELTGKIYEDTIRRYAKTARIPGFRKGKVPRQVLLQQVGPTALRAASLEDLVETSIRQAIQQESLRPAGQAKVSTPEDELFSQFNPGSPFTFSVVMDIFPEVELGDYTGLTIEAEEVLPDGDRFNNLLEQQRVQSATLMPVEDRPAKLGDVVIVDYKGELLPQEPDADAETDGDEDDVDTTGLSAEDFQVELDPERFIPGFVDGIVGMEAGDTKDITVTFPEDYARQDLAGRGVKFAIVLHEIKERELPEVTDEFIRSISQYETLDALKEALESQFKEEADRTTDENKKTALLKALVENTAIELPESLVQQEMSYMVNQAAAQLQNQGIDVQQFLNAEMIDRMKENARPEAEFQVKVDLILQAIGKREGLEVDNAEVQAQVKQVMKQLGSKGNRARVESVVYEDLYKDRVTAWLLEQSEFTLVPAGTLTPAEDGSDDADDDTEATDDAPDEAPDASVTPSAAAKK